MVSSRFDAVIEAVSSVPVIGASLAAVQSVAARVAQILGQHNHVVWSSLRVHRALAKVVD